MRVAALLLVVLAGAGCAAAQQSRAQAAVRREAQVPVAAATGDVPGIFKDLANAAGLDTARVYVAIESDDSLNASALGNHHFYVTRGIVARQDFCLLTGIAAHEIAHDVLRHPETIATTADVTEVFSTVLGSAAGLFVPGAGFLVQGVTTLGLRAYSRSQESEADALAIRLLRAAGKPEWSLRYALEVLQRHGGAARGATWLSTHPAMADRIAGQPRGSDEDIGRLCGPQPASRFR